MLNFVKINRPHLLRYFSELFFNHVKVRLPLDYLSNVYTYLIYNTTNNKIVGGYAIIYKPPFRFIDLLPQHIKSEQSFLTKSLDDFYEVNGFFVEDSSFTFDILEKLLSTILCLEKKYLLLFYDLNNKKIHNTWQKNLNPILIYSGQPNTEADNLKSHKNIYFGYVKQENIKKFLEKVQARKAQFVP